MYLIFEPRSTIFSHRKLAYVNLLMKRYKPVEIFITLLKGVFRKNMGHRILRTNVTVSSNVRSAVTLCTVTPLRHSLGAVVRHTVFALRRNCTKVSAIDYMGEYSDDSFTSDLSFT